MQCVGCHWFTPLFNVMAHHVPQHAPCKTIRIAHQFLLNCKAVVVVLPSKSCQIGAQFLLNIHGRAVDEGARCTV